MLLLKMDLHFIFLNISIYDNWRILPPTINLKVEQNADKLVSNSTYINRKMLIMEKPDILFLDNNVFF